MFSGEETSNEEHVLPRWMQRRFNLGDQCYHLPNGTSIAYKHAKVPVAEEHNSRFSAIEDRVSRGVATLQEIYLWAFKVHVGLIHRTSTLKIDIRSPSSPSFWNLDGFGQEIWLFQTLYSLWTKNGNISPDPFGTVLRMKALTPQPGFDFVHNMQSGTLFFQLGDEVLFIALYDQARTARSNVVAQFEYQRQFISTLPAHTQQDAAQVGQRVWACETAYFHHRSRQGMSFVSTKNSFQAVPPMFWARTRPSDSAELAEFCRSFGLKLEHFGGEAGHRYSNLTEDDIRALLSR
ncbi:hypothetical protein [Burkholderia stagnalis]|uniref:hypothetical protein n=1 Tax=Burkholderia stagnalis TaxID=1503054 RepID=UPI000A777297|nr:hypothetical protein [Burkholderia stagnalis]